MLLTTKEAFQVMFVFLENYFKMTQSDDIGALLGSLMLLEDGEPADPGTWHDWLCAVKEVKGE
jgi:hypothetical protein